MTDEPSPTRPLVTEDYYFFFDGLAEEQLLAQRCGGCGNLRHPPQPMCPDCGSFTWTPEKLSGRGTVHSYAVHIHPPFPDYPSPHAIALVDMEEGVRVLGALVGAEPSSIRIGEPVAVEFAKVGEIILHRFRRTTER